VIASVVRLEAFAALAAVIAAAIPELDGHICEGMPPSSEHEEVPNLSIIPGRWMFEPEQALEQRVLPGNVVVWNVGQHSAPMTLSIVAATPFQRAKLEAQILDLFLSSTHPLNGMHRPGVLVVPVTSCPDLQEWLAAFELESDEWDNSAAFDRRYESKLVITGIIPALTIQRPVYTINSLRLGLGPYPSTSSETVEVVSIAVDGTITPSTF
jgi:hypothetical protein